MAKDFSKRLKATQRYAGTTAGFYNDPLHVSGIQTNYPVTPVGGFVFGKLIFNTSPASGSIYLSIGKDPLAVIGSANATGDKAYNCYLYDQLFYSCDAACDVTFIVTGGTRGVTS